LTGKNENEFEDSMNDSGRTFLKEKGIIKRGRPREYVHIHMNVHEDSRIKGGKPGRGDEEMAGSSKQTECQPETTKYVKN
jgi:hypothetical protein